MSNNVEEQVHSPSANLPVEQKLRASTPIARTAGRAQLMPRDMGEAMELAKLMAKAEGMVGVHLLGNPGACLGIVIQGMEWGISPYAVAMKSYIASKPKEGEPLPPISYEAQLLHAVVLRNAPLKGRLQHEYIGDGDELRCKVWGTFIGEDAPCVLESEPLKALLPGKNQFGNLKGSPLWLKKPKQQIFYNTVRDWARMYCPDVILGAYSRDEMAEYEEVETETKQIDPFAGPGPRVPAIGGGVAHGEPAVADTASAPVPVTDAASSSPQLSAASGAVEPTVPAPAFSIHESGEFSSPPEPSVAADPTDGAAGASSNSGVPAALNSPTLIADWAGKQARRAGKSEGDNPYDAGSPEWDAWLAGFNGVAK